MTMIEQLPKPSTIVRRERRRTQQKRAPTVPRKVDWNDTDQLDAVVLSAFGFSAKAVSEITRLTKGQVGYRCKLTTVRCTDYRNLRPNTRGGEVGFKLMAMKQKLTPPIRRQLSESATAAKNGKQPSTSLASTSWRL